MNNSLFQNKKNFLIIDIIISIISLGTVLFGTSIFGAGVSSDSVAYIHAAKTFAAGEGLQYFAYTSPFIQWPPLFPIILSIANIAGINVIVFSRFINAIFMAASLFITTRMLRKILKNKIVPFIFLTMCVVSFPLIKMAFYVWSEPLYILFSSIIFYILFTFDFKKVRLKPIILLGIFTALACLTRYIGVTIVFAVSVYLLFNINGWWNKIKYIAIYDITSVIPIGIFLIRNLILSDTLVGMRPPAQVGLMTNVLRTVKTVAKWIFPQLIYLQSNRFLIYGLACVIILAFVYLFISSIKIDKEKNHLLLFMTAFSCFYLVYMIISATKVAFDALSDRYLSPTFLPIMVIIAIMLDTLFNMLKGKRLGVVSDTTKKFALGVLGIYLCFFCINGAINIKQNVSQALESGMGGITSKVWNDSSLHQDIKLVSDSDMIYSNSPSHVYMISDRPTHYTPKITAVPIYSFNSFMEESKSYKNQYMIWFGEETSTSIYDPNKLKDYFDFKEIIRNHEYVIYKMEGKANK